MSRGGSKKRARRRRQRLEAAEEVCWKCLILMGLGELEMVPQEFREVLGPEMEKWAALAVKTGKLRP